MHIPFGQSSSEPLESSARWIASLFVGELATILCIIAVAFVGFFMMSGQLAIRRGMVVVLGCFVLLGASVIAGWFMAIGSNRDQLAAAPRQANVTAEFGGSRNLPAATYDPYAGASLRQD